MAEYPVRGDADILHEGFSKGFPICYHGPRLPRDSNPLASASSRPLAVQEDKLQHEISLGRIAGPFSARPFKNLQCSPIGLVPKSQPGNFRMIHHLSYPEGHSINDFIEGKLCAVHYASFDSAVDLVVRAGVDAWLAKTGIKSAFRLLPVSPVDYELFEFTFDGSFYYDKCLPMGCSIACSMFEKFGTFLEFHFMKVNGCPLVTHYLDDFLFVAPSAHSCAHLLDMFTSLCEEVGVPLAPRKQWALLKLLSIWVLR